jgi:serine/threonine-protein kinase
MAAEETVKEDLIPAEEIRRQLDALVASPFLAMSAQLCRFLRHVVERTVAGDVSSLKESLLGNDVFDRGSRFDPRTDPVVRVEARRLRAKLEEYYAAQATQSAVVIRLPKGTYVPVFSRPEIRSAPAVLVENQLTVAVLPFVSVGADAETEYFADGLTDEVINLLGHIPGMNIVARSSVYHFKGRTADARELGRRLNATHLVEGSVRRDKRRLRVAAQFVEARNGYQIWAQTFERDWKQIFAIQHEIASTIATKLRLPGSGNRTPLYTENLEAYNVYLKGRYYWNKRTPEGFQSAIDAFRQAIDLEPNYAPAWSGLADSYTMLGFMHYLSPVDLRRRARAAAERAVALDPTLAAAHTAFGNVLAIYDWEWQGAMDAWQRAIDIDANTADAHYGLSKTLASLGRIDEAIPAIRRAHQLDPLSLMISVSLAWELSLAESYQESDQAFQSTRDLDRNFVWSYVLQSWSYQARGLFDRAIAWLQKATELTGGTSSLVLGELAHALGKSGQEAKAEAVLAKLIAAREGQYVSPFDLSRAYEGLHRRSEALDAMHRACDEHAPMLLFVKADPVFDSLRGEPRFADLLKRLNLS